MSQTQSKKLLETQDSALDYEIEAITLDDFIEDERACDSDILRSGSEAQRSPEVSIKYDLDECSGELIPEPEPSTSGSAVGSPKNGKRLSQTPPERQPPSKKAKGLTAYEEALLELQTAKIKESIQQQRRQHEIKMEILERQLAKEKEALERVRLENEYWRRRLE